MPDTNVVMHPDVQRVCEFMQRNTEACHLVSVASAIAGLAPSLWGHYPASEIVPLRIQEPDIT